MGSEMCIRDSLMPCKGYPSLSFQWDAARRLSWAITDRLPENDFDPVMTYIGNLDAEPLADDKWERLDQWMFNIDDPSPLATCSDTPSQRSPGCSSPGASSGNSRCCLDRRG